MSIRIAGQARIAPEVVHVNYADVLEQAVANERFRILSEVEKAAKRIATTTATERSRYDGYGMDRPAAKYKADLLAALEGLR